MAWQLRITRNIGSLYTHSTLILQITVSVWVPCEYVQGLILTMVPSQQWYMSLDRSNGDLLPGSHDEPSRITIGYEQDAIRFSVPGNKTQDSGFLKVFVSTEYVNMKILLQEPPFTAISRGAKLVSFARAASYWNAWTYVLTTVA
jgi:hypothetical protein